MLEDPFTDLPPLLLSPLANTSHIYPLDPPRVPTLPTVFVYLPTRLPRVITYSTPFAYLPTRLPSSYYSIPHLRRVPPPSSLSTPPPPSPRSAPFAAVCRPPSPMLAGRR
ncbi:hypothetical protein K525DRAFT_275503 [Schizophyllum commune Loenen D]|nr:hypothetical protein K525DRAFT_275503 [Schizophyllum commune Loenen D]